MNGVTGCATTLLAQLHLRNWKKEQLARSLCDTIAVMIKSISLRNSSFLLLSAAAAANQSFPLFVGAFFCGETHFRVDWRAA